MTYHKPLYNPRNLEGANLASIGAWYMLKLAKEGRREEFLQHRGGHDDYDRARALLGITD